MEFVVGMLVLGLVVAIAAAFVVREAGRIAQRPPPALFDRDDAFEWVIEHLPDDVAATLTESDVRWILERQVEFFERKGVSGNGSGQAGGGPVVIGSAETVAYIVEQSERRDEPFLPEQVHPVVDILLRYLRSIGAVGPPAADDPGAR